MIFEPNYPDISVQLKPREGFSKEVFRPPKDRNSGKFNRFGSMNDEEQIHISRYILSADRDSFGFLYRKYEHRFINYARTLKDHRILPEDILQDAVLKVLRNPPKGKSPESFNFYGYFIASLHNTFIDHIRDVKRKAVLNFCPIERVPEPAHSDYHESDYTQLYLRINQLPIPLKEVISMRLDGLRYKEIAKLVKTNVNTARGRFRYAAAHLEENKKEILSGTLIA